MKFTLHNHKTDSEFIAAVTKYLKIYLLIPVTLFFYYFTGPVLHALSYGPKPRVILTVLAQDQVWSDLADEVSYYKKYHFDKYEWDSDIKRKDLNVIERKL